MGYSMKLIKAPYSTAHGRPLANATQRIEFFFHYWQYVFSNYRLKYDSHIFKSHRTIINKMRLQIEGNYSHSNTYINKFYTNENLFNANSFFKTHINSLKINTNFTNIEALFLHINAHPKDFYKTGTHYRDPALLIHEIFAIEGWLNKYYTKFIVGKLLKELSKDTAINYQDTEKLKQLINCLIIELLHRGYDTKFLTSVPEILFDEKRFPFAKIFTDFTTKEKYDEYKGKEFAKLNIKTQLKGLTNLVNRNPKTFYVVFRVDNVGFKVDPITILDVEFYNPLTHPKITVRNNFNLFEEYFSFKNQPKTSQSECNLIVKVSGYREESLMFQGYKKAIDALNVFNKELQQNGRITLKNAFITNDGFNRMFGSTTALKKEYNIIDKIEDDVRGYFSFINKLNVTNKYDKKVITFISQISNTLRSNTTPVRLEEFWYAFESTFGTERELKAFLKNCYKIYNKENILANAKMFLNSELNNIMKFHLPNETYNLSKEQMSKYGLNITANRAISTTKFKNNLTNLRDFLKCKFISMFIDEHRNYFVNRAAHEVIVNNWIDYNIDELYVERNLSSHRKMNDDFFYHKRFEIVSMTYTILRIFLPRYLKHRTRVNIKDVLTEINHEAGLII